jgi:hypothetical protein
MQSISACLAAFAAASLCAPAFSAETITYKYDALGRLINSSSSGTVNTGHTASTNYDAAGNRISYIVRLQRPTDDFNGDGYGDILWRNTDGTISDWLGTATGGFISNYSVAASAVSTSWQIVETGDFDGDGRSDILWRNGSTGELSNWLGTPNGAFAPNDANAFATVSTVWRIVRVGDFNGDGRSDILWRHTDGTIVDWLGTPNGGWIDNAANSIQLVTTTWHIANVGDFNGDGRTDILWRSDGGQVSDWLGTASGAFTSNDANALTTAPSGWDIVGTGDFNGDGRSDILWRNSSTGAVINWLGTATGSFTDNSSNAPSISSTGWTIVDVADYNGDGRADILWRNLSSGGLSNWLGTTVGGFTDNGTNSFATVSTDWVVQIQTYLMP